MKTTVTVILSALALALHSNAAVVFTEAFAYPDGPLVGAAGSPWTVHSGTGPVDVVSGAASLTGADGEDVNATLAGSPYSSGTLLTATFDVVFSTLPAGTGTYFAHFKDTGTSNFRARTTASVTGAAVGSYRLGISNDGNATTFVSLDLSLGTSYAVTITWNTDTNQSSISIDGGAAVIDTDGASSVAISSFALRQSSTAGPISMGALVLDDLVVDATIIPEPSSVVIGLMGMVAIFRRRRWSCPHSAGTDHQSI